MMLEPLRNQLIVVCAAILLGQSTLAYAELRWRSGNIYYDDVLDVTWIHDADGFGCFVSGCLGVDPDPVSWDEATALASEFAFSLATGWRLPKMDVNVDGVVVDCAVATEAECRDNELGFMYWHYMGGNPEFEEYGVVYVGNLFFEDVDRSFWSSTESADDPANSAWTFDFRSGLQTVEPKNGDPRSGWMVLDGDIDDLMMVGLKINFDGDGAYEVAAVRDVGGRTKASVNGYGRVPGLKPFWFSAHLTGVDGAVIEDLNANVSEEIAVLGVNTVSGVTMVEIRDPLMRTRIKTLKFYSIEQPIDLEVMSDQNANGVSEAAVLGIRRTDGKGAVVIRDLLTKDKLAQVKLGVGKVPMQVGIAPDLNGNGTAEVLVLATRRSDQRGVVLIYDTAQPRPLRTITLPRDHALGDFHYIEGPGGIPSVVVALFRQTDDRARLLTYDALTGEKLWGRTAGRFEPMVVATRHLGDDPHLLGRGIKVKNRALDTVVMRLNADTGEIMSHWTASSVYRRPLDMVGNTLFEAWGFEPFISVGGGWGGPRTELK